MRMDDTDRVPLIVAVVAAEVGVSVDDITRHDKHAGPSLARHVSWACMWMLTSLPVSRIASTVGFAPRTVNAAIGGVLDRDGGTCDVSRRDVFLACMAACEAAIMDAEARMTAAVV